MSALRELLLSLRVKVDKAAIKQTDVAFDHAAKSAQVFENGAYKALAPIKKIGEALTANVKKARELAKALLPAGALPSARPEAPSDRRAREMRDAFGLGSHPTPPRPGQSLAAPDVSKFMAQPDTRSGPVKALGALRTAAQSALASAGSFVDRFNARFDGTVKAIFSARTAMAGFALVVAGTAIGRFFNDVIEAGGALHDMSQRTRVSVESLQVWRSIAADAGVDAGAIEGAFRKLNKSMAAAARGAKLPAGAFSDLGVEIKNADGSLRPIEEVLIDTGSALAGLDDDAKATALATQLLGASGMGLVPAFNGGSDAVRKLSAELRENVALNAEEAARLDDVGDALSRGVKKWTAIKARIAVVMLPVLEAVANGFEKVSKWVLRTVKETQGLLTVLGGAGLAGLTRFSFAIGSWIAKTAKGKEVLQLLSGGLRSAASAALRFLMPLLLIEDFLTFLSGGKSVIGRGLEEIFGEGGANEKRAQLLTFFQNVSKVLTEEVMPVIRDIANSPFFSGALKVIGETFLGILNLIGLAFASDSDKIDEMGSRFLRNTNAIGDAIDGLISKMKEFLGLGSDEPVLPVAPQISAASQALAAKSTFFADEPAQPYSVLFGGTGRRVTAADGPVPAASVPRAQQGGAMKSVQLTDNRKIEVNVGSNQAPAWLSRAIASDVDTALTKDRRQTLNAL